MDHDDGSAARGSGRCEALLDLFDAEPAGENRFTAQTGIAGVDERQVVEGTQVLGAVDCRCGQTVSGQVGALGVRGVRPRRPGRRRTGGARDRRGQRRTFHRDRVVTATQNGKRCITTTVLADVPIGRRDPPSPAKAGGGGACRGQRVADADDRTRGCGWSTSSTSNSPDEVGPPELYAWLHYDPIPSRDDLAKALIAYFTGHLGISTTMRAHEGIGTSQAHLDGLDRSDDGLGQLPRAGALGRVAAVHTTRAPRSAPACPTFAARCTPRRANCIASFTQDALIRPLRTTDTSIKEQSRL